MRPKTAFLRTWPKFFRPEAIVACAMLVGVTMFVAPLPGAVLDVMVALNLCAATMILVGVVYARSMLDYSSLPTLLLITTMFRVALEVAITRMILLEAHAGEIVEAFGEIVAGGNLAVGIVIFVILTAVNFIVITKGGERIAEVGARFSLDAMPGKQMAIDAGLRAGHVTADDAIAMRRVLERESQMHGAMDGAMKFVKGDAIAGIIILLVNMIGGLVVGTQLHAMSMGEAARLYSVLSIGEGLVSQLPSLMISVAAGMLVTLGDGNDDKEAKASAAVVKQLFSGPTVICATGGVMISVSFVPGIPVIPFVPIGVICVAAGALRHRRERSQAAAVRNRLQGQPVDDVQFTVALPYRLELEVPPKGEVFGGHIEERVRAMRNSIVGRGYMLPVFDVRRTVRGHLHASRIRFLVTDVPFIDVIIAKGDRVSSRSASSLVAAGIVSSEREFVRGAPPLTVIDAASSAAAATLGIETADAVDVLVRSIEEVVWSTSSSFISLDEAQRMMKWAQQSVPALHEAAKQAVPLQTLAQVIRALSNERVSLRNGFAILDAVYQSIGRDRDVETLVEKVRVALRYEICQQIAPDANLLVVLLSPATEDAIRSSLRRSAGGTYAALTLEDRDRFMRLLRDVCAEPQTLSKPIALATVQDLRPQLRRLIAEELPSLPVVSYAELTNHLKVTPVGEIALESTAN